MRSVEIVIVAVSDGGLAVSIDYHRHGAGAVKRWVADRSVVDAICDDLEEVLSEACEMPFTDSEKAEQRRETEERLISLGLALFQEIMKEEGDTLRARSAGPEEGRYLVFKIDKTLAYIPLELMHDGRGFLSHSMAVGRIILTDDVQTLPYTAGKPPFRALIVGDPTDDPAVRDDIEREIDAIKGVFAGRKDYAVSIATGLEVDQRFVLSSLPGTAVFHFTGHGAVSQESGTTGIKLPGGKVLSGSALRGLQNSPHVVFLNMCTAAPRAAWKGSLSIVEIFLRRGVRACIASLWDLRSKSATTMASRFYTYLLRGDTFGHALRKSRVDTATSKGIHDPTWAAYALYGDPCLSLVPEAGWMRRSRRAIQGVAIGLGLIVYLAFSLFPAAIHKETIGTGRYVPVGYLLVESSPIDATILVDGKAGTRTPGTIELPVGRYHLVVEKPGYKRWEAWVEVKESARTDIRADLVKIRP